MSKIIATLSVLIVTLGCDEGQPEAPAVRPTPSPVYTPGPTGGWPQTLGGAQELAREDPDRDRAIACLNPTIHVNGQPIQVLYVTPRQNVNWELSAVPPPNATMNCVYDIDITRRPLGTAPVSISSRPVIAFIHDGVTAAGDFEVRTRLQGVVNQPSSLSESARTIRWEMDRRGTMAQQQQQIWTAILPGGNVQQPSAPPARPLMQILGSALGGLLGGVLGLPTGGMQQQQQMPVHVANPQSIGPPFMQSGMPVWGGPIAPMGMPMPQMGGQQMGGIDPLSALLGLSGSLMGMGFPLGQQLGTQMQQMGGIGMATQLCQQTFVHTQRCDVPNCQLINNQCIASQQMAGIPGIGGLPTPGLNAGTSPSTLPPSQGSVGGGQQQSQSGNPGEQQQHWGVDHCEQQFRQRGGQSRSDCPEAQGCRYDSTGFGGRCQQDQFGGNIADQ